MYNCSDLYSLVSGGFIVIKQWAVGLLSQRAAAGQYLMSELSKSKCRYLAEFAAFRDLEQECSSNSQFIEFVLCNFAALELKISKEVESRTFEKEHMKSPLARQIREQLINFVSRLNANTVGAIRWQLQKGQRQIKLLGERAQDVISNNKECVAGSQSYYLFYKQKLADNTENIESISHSIQSLAKQQIIKTKELEVRGSSIDREETSKYQSQREVLSMQISNLERANKRFRSDLQIETQRLICSYQHLTNSLVKELKRSENQMVDIVSALLHELQPFVRDAAERGDTILEEIYLQEMRESSRQSVRSASPIFFEQTYPTDQENLHIPTFPGKESREFVNGLDSLFFSKSIEE